MRGAFKRSAGAADRRRMAIVIIVTVICVAAVPAIVSAMTWRWSGTGANGYFWLDNPDGGWTDVNVWAQDATTVFHGASHGKPPWAASNYTAASHGKPPWAGNGGYHAASHGAPTRSEMASADIYMFRYIPSTVSTWSGGTYVDVWGWTSEADFTTGRRLNGATLVATIDGWMEAWGDEYYSGPVTIEADLTWATSGPMYRFRSSSMWSGDGFRNMWSSNGQARGADVTGEIWVDGMEILEGAVGSGEVMTERSMERWQ